LRIGQLLFSRRSYSGNKAPGGFFRSGGFGFGSGFFCLGGFVSPDKNFPVALSLAEIFDAIFT
jgi:hypothetical protein